MGGGRAGGGGTGARRGRRGPRRGGREGPGAPAPGGRARGGGGGQEGGPAGKSPPGGPAGGAPGAARAGASSPAPLTLRTPPCRRLPEGPATPRPEVRPPLLPPPASNPPSPTPPPPRPHMHTHTGDTWGGGADWRPGRSGGVCPRGKRTSSGACWSRSSSERAGPGRGRRSIYFEDEILDSHSSPRPGAGCDRWPAAVPRPALSAALPRPFPPAPRGSATPLRRRSPLLGRAPPPGGLPFAFALPRQRPNQEVLRVGADVLVRGGRVSVAAEQRRLGTPSGWTLTRRKACGRSPPRSPGSG